MSRHRKFIFNFLRASAALRQPRNKKIVLQYLFVQSETFFEIVKVAFISADVDMELSPGNKVIDSKRAGADVKLEDDTDSNICRGDILAALEK